MKVREVRFVDCSVAEGAILNALLNNSFTRSPDGMVVVGKFRDEFPKTYLTLEKEGNQEASVTIEFVPPNITAPRSGQTRSKYLKHLVEGIQVNEKLIAEMFKQKVLKKESHAIAV